MDPAVWAGALVAAITGLTGAIGLLYKALVSAKDQVIAIKDQQLLYRESIIAGRDAQIAALQSELKQKDDRLDKSIDTLGDAVRMLEAGPLPPSRRVGGGTAMIERIKRWWRGVPDEDEVDERRETETEQSAEEALEGGQELADARALLSDSRQKTRQADTKIADYQRRIRAENERRLDMARGERRK